MNKICLFHRRFSTCSEFANSIGLRPSHFLGKAMTMVGKQDGIWLPSTMPYDIYARPISPTGSLITDAFAIAETADDEQYPRLTTDSIGALVVWQYDNNSDNDLYARQLGTDGLPTEAAFAVLQAEGDQEKPVMVHGSDTHYPSTGSGRALTTWQDNRETGWDLYAGIFDTGVTSTTITYTYDDLYRLTDAVYTGSITATYVYTYDAAGNMTSYVETIGEDTANVSRTFNPANQLITSTNGISTTNYTYDDNGNLVEIDGAGTNADVRYGFNQRNMLITNTTYVAGTGWVLQAEFHYDGNNDRLEQIAYGSGTPITTTYTNDATGLTNVLVADDGTTETAMLFGLDLIAQDDGAETRILLVDGLGTARTEMVGNNVQTVATYEPFGKLLVQTGTSGTVYSYTGEAHDASTGLVFLRARYYSPYLNRFLSRDPFPGYATLPASQNGFNYVHNNPVNNSDPSGLCVEVGDEACWSVYETIVREFPQAQTESYLYNNEYVSLIKLPENRLRSILGDLRSIEANVANKPGIISFNGVNDIIRYFEVGKYGSASERLGQLLHATASYKIMGLDPMVGLQFGVLIPGGPGLCEAFEDKQYYDNTVPGYEAWNTFKPGSNNQMSHFLTAVALAYYNVQSESSTMSTKIDIFRTEWMVNPSGNASRSNVEIAIRLIVGHELVGDVGGIIANIEQYNTASEYHVNEFISAVAYDVAGDESQRDMHLENILYSNPAPLASRPGNSLEDLRLTLKGWRFGHDIKVGIIGTSLNAASWLRANLTK